MADIIWGENASGFYPGGPIHLVKQSGQFTSTIKDQIVTTLSFTTTGAQGITTDNIDTLVATNTLDFTSYLILYSGQFSSTIKAFIDVTGVFVDEVEDIAWDGDNVLVASDPSGSASSLTLLRNFGSSTVLTGIDVSSIDTQVSSVTWNSDLQSVGFCGSETNDKLYLLSGQFTSTLKDSLDVTSTTGGFLEALSYNGTNTLYAKESGGRE